MADKAYVVRIRKFSVNRLLSRKQFVVDIVHPNRASIPKAEIRDRICAMHKISNPNTVVLFGFKIAYGGGRSTGFGLIYDDIESTKKYTQPFILRRMGLSEKIVTARKAKKERKNKRKKIHGTRIKKKKKIEE